MCIRDSRWPCQRCLRTGRQHQCSYETSTGQLLPVTTTVPAQPERRYDNNEICHLRARNAHLQGLLLQGRRFAERDESVERSGEAASLVQPLCEGQHQPVNVTVAADQAELADHPKNRTPRGYYAQHSLFKFFVEVRPPTMCDSRLVSLMLIACLHNRSPNCTHSSKRLPLNGSSLSVSA